MGRIWTESAHSLGRKATLTLEFMYLTINLIFGTWWAPALSSWVQQGGRPSTAAEPWLDGIVQLWHRAAVDPPAKAKPSGHSCRFGIGIFYVLLYMLLKVAFDSEGWLVQIGNVVQLLYLFLIIVQVGGCCAWHGHRAEVADGPKETGPAAALVVHGLLGALMHFACPVSCPLQLIINLKNKPEAVEKIHSFCAIYFCLYMLVFTGVSIRCRVGFLGEPRQLFIAAERALATLVPGLVVPLVCRLLL